MITSKPASRVFRAHYEQLFSKVNGCACCRGEDLFPAGDEYRCKECGRSWPSDCTQLTVYDIKNTRLEWSS